MKLLVHIKFVIGLLLALSLSATTVSAQQIQFSIEKSKYGAEKEVTREVSYTENVKQSHVVSVPYTENVTQTYQVQVPYTENVSQTYTVEVPYTETVTGDDGKEKEVEKMRTETRTRMVPVQRMRTETRTRMVPVTRTRSETRTRNVPMTRMRTEKTTRKFPPAKATFAYASGKEISDEDLKSVAAEEIPILRLPPGQKLTDLHRAVLKPDTVVMMLPKPEKKAKKIPAKPEGEREAKPGSAVPTPKASKPEIGI